MNSSAGRYDIAVVGGGIVGATAACLLGRCGFSVVLVEAREPARFDATGEVGLRVSAISPGSANVLDQAGAWRAIEQGRCCHFSAMRVEDDPGSAALDFAAAAHGMDRLGTVVEDKLLRSALWDSVRTSGMIDVLCPERLVDCEGHARGVTLRLGSGRVITAGLLVGADGASSGVRRLTGIGRDVWEYNQAGVVSVVAKECPNPGIAWQRFMPGGPLAFLPLADGRSSIVWTRPDGAAADLLSMDDQRFTDAVAEASSGWLGQVRAAGPRASFPLTRVRNWRYAARCTVLLGDAAHVVHPLAGQGVNLGLADAAALAEVLVQGRMAGRILADRRQLQYWERWRRSESEVMAGGIHALRALFMADGLAGLRGIGVRQVEKSWLAKDFLLRRAAGQGRNAPGLSRGASIRDLLHQHVDGADYPGRGPGGILPGRNAGNWV